MTLQSFSKFLKPKKVIPVSSISLSLSMVHDWVARIYHAWKQLPSRSWLPIVEAPGCLRLPTSTFQGSYLRA